MTPLPTKCCPVCFHPSMAGVQTYCINPSCKCHVAKVENNPFALGGTSLVHGYQIVNANTVPTPTLPTKCCECKEPLKQKEALSNLCLNCGLPICHVAKGERCPALIEDIGCREDFNGTCYYCHRDMLEKPTSSLPWEERWRIDRNVVFVSKDSTPMNQIIDISAKEEYDIQLIKSFLTEKEAEVRAKTLEKIKEALEREIPIARTQHELGIIERIHAALANLE